MDILSKIHAGLSKGQKEFFWNVYEWKELEDFCTERGFFLDNQGKTNLYKMATFMGAKHSKIE